LGELLVIGQVAAEVPDGDAGKDAAGHRQQHGADEQEADKAGELGHRRCGARYAPTSPRWEGGFAGAPRRRRPKSLWRAGLSGKLPRRIRPAGQGRPAALRPEPAGPAARSARRGASFEHEAGHGSRRDAKERHRDAMNPIIPGFPDQKPVPQPPRAEAALRERPGDLPEWHDAYLSMPPTPRRLASWCSAATASTSSISNRRPNGRSRETSISRRSPA